ncbi:MAG: GGDEF domain-containing protein [Candidatus Omnitrophica bacterium]|nr:GGDEF domain-containing protein [Candidatus Omnitrophota bacterium]
MQAAAVSVWMLAMVAGLCWARWAVATLATASVLTSGALQLSHLGGPAGWVGVIAVGVTPWLLASQRSRYERRVKRLQARESVKLSQLQEHGLLRLQRENEERESTITQITTLYHVTKATARALHVQELFAFSLELVPKLLDVKGLRLIDLVHQVDDSPLTLRAHRVSDGRLLRDEINAILPIERAVIQQVARAGAASTSEATALEGSLPTGLTRLAWAPLWNEQRPIGVVIADDLPPDQADTLSIVANQLSLQLTRVHLYEAIEAMAITDTLTGLLVRRYFLELAAEELQRSARHGLPCTVIMTDLDFFKAKNDTYGHLVGDVVLREVAQLVHKNLRGIDLIARYGGEEFVLLLVETGPDQAAPIAERLRQLMEVHQIRAYDETLSQTVSLGIAGFPEDGRTLEDLIARADEALYAAKHAGRNRVIRWTPSVHSPPSTVHGA